VSVHQRGILLELTLHRSVMPLIETPILPNPIAAPRVLFVPRHASQSQFARLRCSLEFRREGHADAGRAEAPTAEQLPRRHGLDTSPNRQGDVAPPSEASVLAVPLGLSVSEQYQR
jgi:hypothetical protein